MLIRTILFSLFFLSGCGKDVKIPTDLEKFSSVTTADSQEAISQGTISKGASVILIVSGKSYKISPFSSKNASDFIDSLPAGDQSVKFRGELKGDEAIIKRFY